MLMKNTPLLPHSATKSQPARLLDQKYPEDYPTPYQRPPELLDYLAVIKKHKWLVTTIVLVVTSIAALYLAQTAEVYEATTVIRIEQQSNPH